MLLAHSRPAHLSSLRAVTALILVAAWIAAVAASHGPLTTLTSLNHPRGQNANPIAKEQQQPRSQLAATGQPSASLQDIQLTDAGPGDKAVKPLLPLDGVDFAVLGIIIFSLSLAGGAGIGGGAILVPVYLMLRGWPTAVAVALSNVTILVSAEHTDMWRILQSRTASLLQHLVARMCLKLVALPPQPHHAHEQQWPLTAGALCCYCMQGGSFANFICNVRRHRPNGKRTIDWE